MTDDIPEPDVKPARRSLSERFSIVWLVPIAALVVSAAIVWQSYADRGELISISFDNASGVHADQTELRYRDVAVGMVERVRFAEGLSSVIVDVRVDKDVAPYIDSEAQFWVVRPEVTSRGVAGLDTVLSGVYIEGVWNESAGETATNFEGLPRRPSAPVGTEGVTITLRSTEASSLADGTPVLFRGIEVGQVSNPRLSEDGISVVAEAFIRAPNDTLLTTNSRFWDSSGFTFSLGAQGAQIDVKSLASLLSGGVSFTTQVSGGDPVGPDTVFTLYADEGTARASLFEEEDDGELIPMAAVFSENVSGLSAGSPVEFNGVRVGAVTGLTGVVDPDAFGDDQVRLLASLEISAQKLGLGPDALQDEVTAFFREEIASGLRAQLANRNLLSGDLKIVLQNVPDAAPAELILRGPEDVAVLPSVPAELTDVAATAEGVLNRINNLPVEELMQSAITVLDNVSLVVGDPALRDAPDEVLALLGDVRGVIGAPEIQNLPTQAAELMAEITASVTEVQTLLADINREQIAATLAETLREAGVAAENVADASEGLPAIADNLAALSQQARELPLDVLLERASALISSADVLLSDEDTRAVPERLNSALAQAEAAISDLREGGAVESVNAAADAARSAAESAEEAMAGLPALSDRLNGLVSEAENLMSGYNANSALVTDVRAMLRDVRDAAKSISALSRAIERNPNSLLLGR